MARTQLDVAENAEIQLKRKVEGEHNKNILDVEMFWVASPSSPTANSELLA